MYMYINKLYYNRVSFVVTLKTNTPNAQDIINYITDDHDC